MSSIARPLLLPALLLCAATVVAVLATSLAVARVVPHRYAVSVAIGVPATMLGLPQIAGPDDTALPLVVIDAGHGGHDPGARSIDGRLAEKDLTLAIATAIRTALIATGRVRVALTRTDDNFLVLEERYGIARRLGADLFISIHADASPQGAAAGASIYTLSEVAVDAEAARFAARENKADILNGVDLGRENASVGSILIDLAQRETMERSSAFARELERNAAASIPFRAGPHRFAGFVVLKAPDMPSVLLETGFITNADDSVRLASDEGQRRIGAGVRDAVLAYFATRRAVPPTR